MKVGDKVRVLPYESFYQKQGKLRARWNSLPMCEDYVGRVGVIAPELKKAPDHDIPETALDLPKTVPVKFSDGFVGYYELNNLIALEK